jgi:type I restriction enzyme M protein
MTTSTQRRKLMTNHNIVLSAIGSIARLRGYSPVNRHVRKTTWSEDNPNGRWRSFDYEELIQRDKVNLDIFWIKDESLEDSDNLPEPDVILQEIIEDLESALEQLRGISEDVSREFSS